MRKDITHETVYRKEGEKLNVSAKAREFGCCWRTMDKRIHPERYKSEKKRKRIYSSKLDNYKNLIDQKIESENIPSTGIFMLLKERHGYEGSYSTVKNYVSKKKKNIMQDLTIRFETIPGYQSQVDWKESMTLRNVDGIEYKFSIFLIVCGYSRFKYIELTSDRTQITLLTCLIHAFEYFGGTTDEIIFDNMKTVVDHAKSDYKKVVINSKFNQFSKDALFKIYTCRPYRPQTKGRVETLAKVMNRLKAYDYEFNDWDDLNNIVKYLLNEINYNEKSQATKEIPSIKMEKEKEYLIPVNIDLLKIYISNPKTYKVSKESMITYQGKKYSVPTCYVGYCLSVKEDDEFINIYYTTNFICSYNKNTAERFNYKKNDYLDILNKSVYKEKSIEEISQISLNNLSSLNEINIEEE